MTKNDFTPPVFPNWRNVIETLFSSDVFRSLGFNRDNLLHYLNQIDRLKAGWNSPLKEPTVIARTLNLSAINKNRNSSITEQELFQKYATLTMRSNEFKVVGNPAILDFENVSENVIELMNLESVRDFSWHRIFGQDDAYELYHPEDVLHIIRFRLVALLISTIDGVEMNPFEDYFQLTFRTGFNNQERQMIIHRKSFMNKSTVEFGTKYLDIWSVEKGHDDFDHVISKIVSHDRRMNVVLKNLYFIANCSILQIQPRDIILAGKICKYDTKEFPTQLNNKCVSALGSNIPYFSNAYCHNMKSKLMKKITNRIVEYTKGRSFKQSIQRKSFSFHCAQLGILNLPDLLEKCIWREVATKY